MYKFKVKYTDLDDNEREEELLFNYTDDELLAWQADHGNLVNYLNRMVNQFNAQELMDWLSAFIIGAYGIKSDDGRIFDKSSEYVKTFKDSVPFHTYYQLILRNKSEAEKFIMNVVPKKFKEEIQKELQNNSGSLPASTTPIK